MKTGTLVMVHEPNDHWAQSDIDAVTHGGRLWIVDANTGFASADGKVRDDLIWCRSLAVKDMCHPWYTFEMEVADDATTSG